MKAGEKSSIRREKAVNSQISAVRTTRLSVQRTFGTTLRTPREVRRWMLGLLPDTCGARDDCALALSELAANAAEHGGPGALTVRLVHDDDGLAVTVIHYGIPTGRAEIDSEAVAEMALLACLTDQPDGSADPLVGTLRESGRGLLVVELLSGPAVEIEQTATSTITRFRLDACACRAGTA